MRTLITIFKRIFLFTTLVLISFGEPAMAKDFIEVKAPRKILESLYDLIDIAPPVRGVSYTKQAPLQTVMWGEQKGNIVVLTVSIRNPNDFEWFLQKKADRFIWVFDDNRNSVGDYPPGGNSEGIEVSAVPPSDRDYWLLDPQEVLEIKVEIPAQDFYDIWKKENMYLQYIVDSSLPPMLKYLQQQVDPDNYYTAMTKSNCVRIRCAEYYPMQGQYRCEIESLPFGK